MRKDLNSEFTFPEPSYAIPNIQKSQDKSLPDGFNCFDALADLPDIDNFPCLVDGDILDSSKLLNTTGYYGQVMRGEIIDCNDFSFPRRGWNPYKLECNKRTMHADHALVRIKDTPEGKDDKKSHRKRLDRTKASHTLRAGTREGKGSHTAVRPIHYAHHRVISVREGGRLMGYPDWMTFHPTKWHGFRLVGNGVPAPLGQAVAKKINDMLSACATGNK